MKNYYEILGLPPGASARQIKKAYVGLALAAHPDLVPDERKEIARKRYREIQTAYWVLSDRRLRERFDRRLDRRSRRRGEELEQTAGRPAPPPLSPSEREELERDVAEAEAALARGSPWEAGALLEKVVERAPGEARWQRLWAQAASRCGAHERALHAAEAAILLDAESPASHHVRAEILAEHGELGRAARECHLTLELDPDHSAARELLRKTRTLRAVLLKQRASVPLLVASFLALAFLFGALLWSALER